jgi:hypothetical protein
MPTDDTFRPRTPLLEDRQLVVAAATALHSATCGHITNIRTAACCLSQITRMRVINVIEILDNLRSMQCQSMQLHGQVPRKAR